MKRGGGRYMSSRRSPTRQRRRRCGKMATSAQTLMIDCIAGYHLNPWTCGIAKFNAILARHLELPHVGIRAVELGSYKKPLLSIKLSEFSDSDAADLDLWSQAHAGQF